MPFAKKAAPFWLSQARKSPLVLVPPLFMEEFPVLIGAVLQKKQH